MADNDTGAKKGRGGARNGAGAKKVLEGGRNVLDHLDEETIRDATEIGGGNRSKGIRIAVAFYRIHHTKT